ncbi:MAG: aldo/keto reductase [Phycisphaerales bacterium]|jgi:aryl-alcohol dehydrogenase-like predicted oxidoreductase|nr:aldo/keto reductase [Phycisphaerales bacterium]
MKKRAFGKTGFDTSDVGLGCWQLGGFCWGDVDEPKAFDILNAAVENGVNFFDTADVYGEGRSEILIGAFLKQCSSDIYIASKLGRFPRPGWPANFTREVMKQHIEASLERLGIDALDLVQLHCIPADVMAAGEVFDYLREFKQEGLIKDFGASVESMDEAVMCLGQDGLASLQVIFNIFRRKPITALFDTAAEKGVAIIARVPLASGLLSGKISLDTQFPENDHRKFNKDGEMFNVGETFAGLTLTTGVEAIDKIRPLVPEGMSMAQMALRWILDHDAVSVVIPGASSAQQALDNSAVSDIAPLTAELHQTLEDIYNADVHDNIRGPY